MALTSAQVTTVIMSRLGGMIQQVQSITGDASQPSIQESGSWGLRRLGYTVADVTTFTDPEVAEVTDADVDVFLDIVELRVLRSLPQNLPAVDTTVGPQALKLSHLLDDLEAMIKRRAKEVEDEHGKRLPGTPLRRARLVLPTS